MIRKTGSYEMKAPKTNRERVQFYTQKPIEESAVNKKLNHENTQLSELNIVLAKEKVSLQRILDEAEPWLQTCSRFSEAEDAFLPREAAKIIGVGPNKFVRTLRCIGRKLSRTSERIPALRDRWSGEAKDGEGHGDPEPSAEKGIVSCRN